MPNREDAWKLLCEYTASESLRKHMLAVETCVRAYAKKSNADEELWGITALLHDFDYERWPNNAHSADQEHPAEGGRILRGLGYPEEMVRAILSHASYSGVARETPLEHTLFACDELAGFLTACTYVRPSKSILDLEVSSVKKRMKQSFRKRSEPRRRYSRCRRARRTTRRTHYLLHRGYERKCRHARPARHFVIFVR